MIVALAEYCLLKKWERETETEQMKDGVRK